MGPDLVALVASEFLTWLHLCRSSAGPDLVALVSESHAGPDLVAPASEFLAWLHLCRSTCPSLLRLYLSSLGSDLVLVVVRSHPAHGRDAPQPSSLDQMSGAEMPHPSRPMPERRCRLDQMSTAALCRRLEKVEKKHTKKKLQRRLEKLEKKRSKKSPTRRTVEYLLAGAESTFVNCRSCAFRGLDRADGGQSNTESAIQEVLPNSTPRSPKGPRATFSHVPTACL